MTRQPPRRTWWRATYVRLPLAVAVFLVLLWIPENLSRHWVVSLGGGWTFDFDPQHVMSYAAVLLLPFARRVGYRKRDLLLVALVPLLGQVWAAKMAQRVICLPWHDWPPRPEQLPFVAHLPGGDGAYVVRPTAGEAALLREEWGVVSEHDRAAV